MAGREVTTEELIGPNIADLRRGLGWTQADLGAAMAERGFDVWRFRQTVAAVEAGKRSATVDEVFGLAEILGVPPLALLVARNPVIVAGRPVEAEDWNGWWGIGELDRASLIYRTGFHSPVAKETRQGQIARLRERRRLLQERHERLEARGRYPGPTFVAEAAVRVLVPIPALGIEDVIDLPAGEPYVARDDLEAQALREAQGRGLVREIPRYQARRMRARGEEQ